MVLSSENLPDEQASCGAVTHGIDAQDNGFARGEGCRTPSPGAIRYSAAFDAPLFHTGGILHRLGIQTWIRPLERFTRAADLLEPCGQNIARSDGQALLAAMESPPQAAI
jgi:hypothetical protein